MKVQGEIQKNHQNKQTQKYKQIFLAEVIALFLICLLLLLERVFYEEIITKEKILIAQYQFNSNLTKKISGEIATDWIDANLFKFVSFFQQPKILFLMMTHVFVTFYVGFQSHLGAKVACMSIIVIVIISFIQLAYKGSRPFWATNQILASRCMNTFNHPSLSQIMSLFVPYFTYYCWKKINGGFSTKTITSTQKIGLLCLFSLICVFQFIIFSIGEVFLINIGLSLLFLLLIILIVTSLNNEIDRSIRRLMMQQINSLNFQFKCLFLILVFEGFILTAYSQSDLFVNINWIKNYSHCTKYLNYQNQKLKYNQILGQWYNLEQTAIVFALIGLIFGIKICHNNMKTAQWFKGTLKFRITRIITANLCLIPSWIFITIIQDLQWIKSIGLNVLMIDSIHFLLLYLFLFGYMPIWLFQKYLKQITTTEEEDYIRLKDQQV